MRCVLGVATVLAAVLLAALDASAQESAAPTLTVRGDVLKPGVWTAADLQQQFAARAQNVAFTTGHDETKHTGTGVPLLALLLAAEPKTEATPKHYDLTFLVILEAKDGYRAFFSLAELLPTCGNAQAWLIWDLDGASLPQQQAPFRLAVLSDQGHDRYIYGITSVTLVDGTKLAARLAGGRDGRTSR